MISLFTLTVKHTTWFGCFDLPLFRTSLVCVSIGFGLRPLHLWSKTSELLSMKIYRNYLKMMENYWMNNWTRIIIVFDFTFQNDSRIRLPTTVHIELKLMFWIVHICQPLRMLWTAFCLRSFGLSICCNINVPSSLNKKFYCKIAFFLSTCVFFLWTSHSCDEHSMTTDKCFC